MALKESTKNEQANSYTLEVAVDGETFEKAINAVYKKEVKRITVPGFRKGKAPRRIVEKMYGSQVFYDDAMQDCYPDALYGAAKEAGVKIVKVESLEALEADKDGFSFKAEIIVEPTVSIDNYLGIEVTKKSTEVTDELVDEEIENVRKRNARLVTVSDREAQNDDTAVIDFEGFVDGEAFDGGKAEGFNLKLGSGNFIPGFEEQIVGHKPGEEFTIDVKFPDDYQAEELKGKDAQFKINLHELKASELPELDDEFVQDVSDKENLAEYKEELKEELAKRLESEAEKDFDNQIADKLIELVEGDIPEAMYENRVNEMLRELDARLRSQGLNLETYMNYMGGDLDTIKAAYKDDAEKHVKLRLALEAIAVKESIEVGDDDLEAEYAKLAEAYKVDVDKAKQIVEAESLSEDIKVEKALKLVKDKASVK